MDAAVVDGNGTETGHIIVTTIGGKNGQPKQVYNGYIILNFCLGFGCSELLSHDWVL